MARKYEKKEYEALKEKAMEKEVLHMLHPGKFGPPKLTIEETAALLAENHETVQSRTAVAGMEATALSKLKTGLKTLGISSLSDLIGNLAPPRTSKYGQAG